MVDTDTIIVPYSILNNASENHLYPSLDGSVPDQLFTELKLWKGKVIVITECLVSLEQSFT